LQHEAVLFLVHVIEDIGFNSPFSLTSFPTTLEYQHGLEERAKSELQKVVPVQLRHQLEVKDQLANGKPFVEIVRLAKEDKADLIVISTHSKPGPKHTHLGSTSEHVLRSSPCAVLVVRHPDYQFVSP
jgi:nucleotide-binding universal stress UspA family protein